ncbi:MAG: NADH-quinone oxidoreductase subunit NuoN [Maricaulaceae bacterium]
MANVINFILPFLPELLLAFFASQLLVFGVGKKGRTDIVRWIAVGLLIVYALSGLIVGVPGTTAFNGALVNDNFSYIAKAILGLSAAAALLISESYLKSERLDKYEFSVLVLYAVLGMSIMVSSNSLLSLYIGIEMQSLALYVLAAFNRDSLRSSEAGLKYFVLGAISSGLLLYGISMIYGFTGSLRFETIGNVISAGNVSTGIIAGMVFMLCGLAFKISAAPFHMWTPDVYEGSPTPVTGFFASAPKFAAMALIARLLMDPFAGMIDAWQQVIIVLAVSSMIVGVFGALMQTNIKRLMAYSSIANMGYALVALAAGTAAGVNGMLIFMTIYLITSIGLFACILQMRIRDGMVEQVSDLSGLSKSQPLLALIFTVLLFSLMGMPPLLGFFGKISAFLPAIDAGLTWLVVVALLASVVGAFYYLRLIKTIWFDEQDRQFVKPATALSALSALSALVLVAVLFLPVLRTPVQAVLGAAANSLF